MEGGWRKTQQRWGRHSGLLEDGSSGPAAAAAWPTGCPEAGRSLDYIRCHDGRKRRRRDGPHRTMCGDGMALAAVGGRLDTWEMGMTGMACILDGQSGS